MRKKLLFLAAVVGLTALFAPIGAHAGAAWPQTKNWVGGASVGFDLTAANVSANNAFGPMVCDDGMGGPGVGGACFQVAGHEQTPLFRVSGSEALTGTPVGIFMGFDLDGDGCVGCTNGNGPPSCGFGGPNQDCFWQGSNVVDGFIPWAIGAPVPADTTLYVFVRLLTVQTLDLPALAGMLTISACQEACNPMPDFGMGTVCVRRDGQPGGDPTGERGCPGQEMRTMYPYPPIDPH